jgi:phosphoglycolate phosphatase
MIDQVDSIIFDMDGTLWDAVDTYVTCWNRSFSAMNLDRQLRREDLEYMMGWEKAKILDRIMPGMDRELQEQVFAKVNTIREEILPELGGELYPGVREGIERLAARYPLFIVSNCPAGLIRLFMAWAGIEPFIKDEMAHGVNNKPKHHNIRLLIEKYQLQNAVYVGDTETDSRESRLAGVPFVFLEGGFGSTEDCDLRFQNFKELTDYFLNINGTVRRT